MALTDGDVRVPVCHEDVDWVVVLVVDAVDTVAEGVEKVAANDETYVVVEEALTPRHAADGGSPVCQQAVIHAAS